MNLYELTIKEAADKLAKGEITSFDLTKSVFERIKEVEPKVGSYITLCEEKAFEMAKASDERRRVGKSLGMLDGIPVAIKDIILTKDIKTTAASKMLENFVPQYDATVTKKLYGAGCVLIGKTNLDEFAMGSSTENSALGITNNPWDNDRVPGGSSGGSAAAVAADECLFALGTDTGGSIRQPSSFCSTTGLKVTYGLVSRYGAISYASSFDTIGPITKSVEDAAIALNFMAGNDCHDSTTVQKELPDYTKFLSTDIAGKTIGVPKEFYGDALDSEVAAILDKAKKTYQKMGAKVIDVSLPLTEYAIATYYILVKSEASSNLSRYDGIHYGHSSINNQESRINNQALIDVYFNSRKGFGREAKRSIMLGTYTLSAGYFDAFYKKAAKVRTLIRQEYEKVFEGCDILLTPVSPFPAFKRGEKIADPLAMYLADINTGPINIAGVPAMSIPAGFTKAGLPVGMQLIGPMYGEDKLFNFGYAWQQETDWHKIKPKLD